MSDIEKVLKIDVPQEITSPALTGRPNSRYTPDVARNILIDIATTPENISDICKKYGTSKQTVSIWRAVNEQFLNAYMRACRYRSIEFADEMHEDFKRLEKDMEDPNADYRKLGIKSVHLDRKYRHKEWWMSKFNRQLFGDKIEVDQNVNINPVKSRETAWTELSGTIQDASYTEGTQQDPGHDVVDDPDGLLE